MKFRIIDAFFVLAIAGLVYAEMCNARQQTSNHFSLRRQIGELKSETSADNAAHTININAVANSVQSMDEEFGKRLEKLEAQK